MHVHMPGRYILLFSFFSSFLSIFLKWCLSPYSQHPLLDFAYKNLFIFFQFNLSSGQGAGDLSVWRAEPSSGPNCTALGARTARLLLLSLRPCQFRSMAWRWLTGWHCWQRLILSPKWSHTSSRTWKWSRVLKAILLWDSWSRCRKWKEPGKFQTVSALLSQQTVLTLSLLEKEMSLCITQCCWLTKEK